MTTATLVRALAQDANLSLWALLVVFNRLEIILHDWQQSKVFIFDEWEDAWAGLLWRTAIAVAFVRVDDVPLMQKYQTQPNVNLKLTTTNLTRWIKIKNKIKYSYLRFAHVAGRKWTESSQK